MRIALRITLVSGLLLAVLASACAPTIDEAGDAGVINLGTPADTAGLLAIELDGVRAGDGRGIVTYPLKDCCTTKTEYALSVDLLDAALLCTDAAERLVEKDDRYVRVGPVLMNSDVLVEGSSDGVSTVVVGVGRPYQDELARRAWGEDIELRTALASVVGFALVDHEADAAVMDFLDARSVEASMAGAASFGRDIVSYELVVRRELQGSGDYTAFLSQVDAAVERLNDPVILSDAVRKQTGRALSEEEVGQWTDWRMRFVSPNP